MMHTIDSIHIHGQSPTPAVAGAMFESLEARELMSAAPRVNAVVADNRGWVTLSCDQDINRTTLNSTNIKIYTAGADDKLGTSDDTKKTVGIFYNAVQRKITVKASLPSDTAYRLLVTSSVKGTNGARLDGEYNGSSPSGNGTAGGNFDISAKAYSHLSDITARFVTSEGTMNVVLFRSNDLVHETVDNFLIYANNAVWDTTFISRKGTFFTDGINVVQGGSYQINSSNKLDFSLQGSPIALQPFLSNQRGTIAMARKTLPDTATNTWFFNVADNSSGLDKLGGVAGRDGYAVFGKVTSSTINVLDATFANDAVDASGDQNIPAVNPSLNSAFNAALRNNLATLPVRSAARYSSNGSVLNPTKDTIKIMRVSINMKVSKTATAASSARATPALARQQFSTQPIQATSSASIEGAAADLLDGVGDDMLK